MTSGRELLKGRGTYNMGLDVKGYQNWRKVVDEDGQVYYQYPNSNLYYNPVLSASKGRSVFKQNLESEMKARKEQRDAQQQQLDIQKQAASPAGQIAPIAGTIAGTLGAGYIANQAWGSAAGATPGVVSAPVTSAGGAAIGAAPSGAGFVSGATGSGTAGAGIGSGAAGTLGGSAPSAPVMVGGSPGVLGVGSAGSALAANAGALGVAPLAAIAGATYLGGKSALDMIQGKEDKSIPGLIGRGSLAIATGGLSEVAKAFLGNHKTTKQVMKERWDGLAKEGIAGAAEQKKALDSLGDMSGKDPVTGEKWDFDVALNRVKSGETAEFNGVYGNYKTFGNDWEKYTPEQKAAIVRANAEAGNWVSNKGDVLYKDEAKARKIKDEVLNQVK